MVGVSTSVNLPLHHRSKSSLLVPGSPGWSQKKGRKMVVVWCGGAFLLTVHGVNLCQHRCKCHICKTKTNKMVFSTEDIVLINVLRQEKGYDN